MAASSRRQLILLVVLLAILAAVLMYRLAPSGTTTVARTATPARRAASAPAAAAGSPVQTVKLAALDDERPAPDEAARNLFRFRERAVAVDGPPNGAGPRAFAGAPVAPAPAGPVPLPGPPPIPLKFIGIVEPGSSGKLAVLSDGRNVFYGREGDTIEGRYRIVRIGVESIEMTHVGEDDRQVIRLSGS